MTGMKRPDKPVPAAAIGALKEILGPGGWLESSADRAPFESDFRGLHRGPTPLVALPDSTARVAALVELCARERIVIDPGFGFGKTSQHNLDLMRAIPAFATLGYAVMVGISRKSVLGRLVGKHAGGRLAASLSAALLLAQRGAHILRVHDVQATVDALKVWQAVEL